MKLISSIKIIIITIIIIIIIIRLLYNVQLITSHHRLFESNIEQSGNNYFNSNSLKAKGDLFSQRRHTHKQLLHKGTADSYYYHHEPGGVGGVLPDKRLMGMCCWMGSHFHDWIDYNGVAFSTELLEWGRTFSDLLG